MSKLSNIPTISTRATPSEIRRAFDAVRVFLTGLQNGTITVGSSRSISGTTDGGGTSVDPTIPPVVTGFTASGAFNTIILQWDYPKYNNHAYTEVFRAAVDDIGQAVKIGASFAGMYPDQPPDSRMSVTYYYWVRNVSTSNVKGPFNATAGTPGSTADDPSYLLELLAGEIRTSHLYGELGSRIDLIDAPGSGLIDQMSNITTIVDDLSMNPTSEIYVQDTAPVPGVGDVPDPIGDYARWFDSDDYYRPYIWMDDGSGYGWKDISDARITQNTSQVSSLTSRISDAEGELVGQADIINSLNATVTTQGNDVSANANAISQVQTRLDTGDYAAVKTSAEASANNIGEIMARYTVKLDVNGYVVGYGLIAEENDGQTTGTFAIRADRFWICSPGDTEVQPFVFENGTGYLAKAMIQEASINNAHIESVAADKIVATSLSAISANLGIVTSGIIMSPNYEAGVSGVLINAYTGFVQINYSGVVGTPGSLADINSEEGNKLSGIQEGADNTANNTAGSGTNILPSKWSFFNAAFYDICAGGIGYPPLPTVVADGYFGDTRLRVQYARDGGMVDLRDTGDTLYNIPITPNKRWIISFFVQDILRGTSFHLNLRTPNNVYPIAFNRHGPWQRQWGVFDLTADTATECYLQIDIPSSSATGDISFDGIMLEEQVGNQTTPSAYNCAGSEYTMLPEDGSTKGASWGGNIAGQPGDALLLNELNGIGGYQEVPLPRVNAPCAIDCYCDNPSVATRIYKVFEVDLGNLAFSSASFNGLFCLGDSEGRFNKQMRVIIGVSGGADATIIESDDVYRYSGENLSAVCKPLVDGTVFAVYVHLEAYQSCLFNGVWSMYGVRADSWIKSAINVDDDLLTFPKSARFLTPVANYTLGADRTADVDLAAQINASSTTIQGGRITTGSVTALQLAANSVTAEEIRADSIETEHLQTSSITTETINGNAVTEIVSQERSSEINIDTGSLSDLSATLATLSNSAVVLLVSVNSTWMIDTYDGANYNSDYGCELLVERDGIVIRTIDISGTKMASYMFKDTPSEGTHTYSITLDGHGDTEWRVGRRTLTALLAKR